jgi:uncharacterized protein (DUF2384 family)
MNNLKSNPVLQTQCATGAVVMNGKQVFPSDLEVRIAVIREGIPASTISNLSSRMGMSKESLLTSLGLSRATISRKEKDATLLSKHESEKVLGVEMLISMVQTLVEESGDPSDFDAARWVSEWLTMPFSALGGKTAASYMDTFEGQKLVANLLLMTQTGAYA